MTVAALEQRALVDRLMSACGGSYSPQIRRQFYISGPQWAASYRGQALFHAPTREPVEPGEVIRHFSEIGIGCWTSHDTDIIPPSQLMTEKQDEILDGIAESLKQYGVQCSMVTGETFFSAVWAGSPAGEQPEVRAYAAHRLENVVDIGLKMGARFIVYWPGTLEYQFQGIVDETVMLKRYADLINAACEKDLSASQRLGASTMRTALRQSPSSLRRN
jgi:xylose isomerase